MATTVKKPEPAKPGKTPEPAAEAPAPKKGALKWILIGVGSVLLLAGGGVAAWLALRHTEPAAESSAAAPEEKKARPAERPKPSVFVALETFTVNLQQESGDHFLQANFSLKVADAGVETLIKQQMPEVRSRLLFLLSSKKPSDLSSVEGKQALANQIAAEVNKALNPDAPPAPEAEGGPVLSVFFTSFIIQ